MMNFSWIADFYHCDVSLVNYFAIVMWLFLMQMMCFCDINFDVKPEISLHPGVYPISFQLNARALDAIINFS